MKKTFLAIALLISLSSFAQSYKTYTANIMREDSAEISDIKILSVTHKDPGNPNYDHPVFITIGMKAFVSSCTSIQGVSVIGQRGTKNELNPSDLTVKLPTKRSSNCVGASGGTEYIQFTLKLSLNSETKYNVQTLSFNRGMLYGYSRNDLYELDFNDLNNVKFDLVKTYSYTSGEVVDF